MGIHIIFYVYILYRDIFDLLICPLYTFECNQNGMGKIAS